MYEISLISIFQNYILFTLHALASEPHPLPRAPWTTFGRGMVSQVPSVNNNSGGIENLEGNIFQKDERKCQDRRITKSQRYKEAPMRDKPG